jgi:hypothetical protein
MITAPRLPAILEGEELVAASELEDPLHSGRPRPEDQLVAVGLGAFEQGARELSAD